MSSGLALPTIQSLWIGDELSVMERLCIASFLENGHPFHLYAYKDIKNVPSGAVIKDAGELIPDNRIFKYKDRDTYAGFSNVFRYKLLFERGNYWVDTDVICLRPFSSESDYVFAKSKRIKSDGGDLVPFWIESCVIKTPPGAEVMNYCYEESIKRNPDELNFGDIGPGLLEAGLNKFKLHKYIEGTEVYCPITYTDWERAISGSPFISWTEQAKMLFRRSLGLHLWNEMWRESETDKNKAFPYVSIYESLKRKYLKDEIL